MPKPKTDATITVTGPGGKTTGPISLAQFSERLGAVGRKPGKRPQIEVDPEEVAKLEKILGPEDVAGLRACDHAELRGRIADLSEHEVEMEQQKKNHAKRNELKDAIAIIDGDFRESFKFLRARRRLAVLLMSERGRPVR